MFFQKDLKFILFRVITGIADTLFDALNRDLLGIIDDRYIFVRVTCFGGDNAFYAFKSHADLRGTAFTGHSLNRDDDRFSGLRFALFKRSIDLVLGIKILGIVLADDDGLIRLLD